MTTVTLKDIAEALGITKRSAERRAANWPYTPDPHPGQPRRLYPLDALPPAVKTAILTRRALRAATSEAVSTDVSSGAVPLAAQSLPGGGVTSPAGISLVPQPADLTDRQRAERDARRGVLAAIARLQAHTACTQEAALITLLTSARAGTLEEPLQRQLRLARDPRGRAGDGYPSTRTLKRWLGAADLAPRQAGRATQIPAWAGPLLKLYGQPQKPSLQYCLEQLPQVLPAGLAAPSYDAARRLLAKLGNVERQRGRHLPRELKNLQAFVRRDTRHMEPGDCYTADGHTLDAEVQHPRHGRPFRPEMTTVLDVATRKCVGWSAGLAESTWAVMDAQRHAIETHGLCALWYVDNGSGYRNAMQADEVTGFAARVGMQITHSLPYNSQARGLEERSHQSLWVRAAKTLPTYMGAAMDGQARNKVFKLTRQHIRAAGSSPLLMPWDTFLGWVQQHVDAYNARPHKALPRMRDPHTGKMRHQSPNEAWQTALDAGWEPTLVTDGERADLFRPRKPCTIARCEIRLFNHLYFAAELDPYHGERLPVGYDIHDPSQVWVYDQDGRFLVCAALDGNRRAYFPQSVIDQAAEKRARAREKRLETHLQEVREELAPPRLIEHAPAEILVPEIEVDTTPRSLAAIERSERREQEKADIAATREALEHAGVTVLPGVEVRPVFTSDPGKYRWLARHPQLWDAHDADWLLDYVASDEYADLVERFEYDGLAWTEQDAAHARELTDFEVATR